AHGGRRAPPGQARVGRPRSMLGVVPADPGRPPQPGGYARRATSPAAASHALLGGTSWG
ncbi:unnamed protein product, partial [Prorocentrum cordatum]